MHQEKLQHFKRLEWHSILWVNFRLVRAVDPTLIMPINVLASEQSNATEVTADKVIKLLNYCNTHPEKKIDIMHLK
jgi:hypothetical protein